MEMKNYKVKLIMSEEYTIDAHNPTEAERLRETSLETII